MRLARLLYPVRTLGPGRRLGIWLQGCKRGCLGCANPELWQADAVGEIDIRLLETTVKQLKEQGYPPIEGVTITGGEPFLQPEALKELMDLFLPITSDILLYTGFCREELAEYEKDILSRAAAVIDGAYLREQNLGHPLKGSENQRIYYRDADIMSRYENYIQAMKGKHLTQTFELRQGKAAPGIHEKDFMESYERRIRILGQEE